ncbi:MAG: MFS transporter [Alphaproteobacteria bacterium]|nr:MFS transporter [Alphaproteobacteria bacterium SS10]
MLGKVAILTAWITADMSSDVRAVILSLGPLLLTFTFFVMGHGLIGTGTAIRLDLEGFSSDAIGIVGTTYAIGFMIGTLIVPKFIGQVGHIRVFAAFASLFVISALAQSLYVDTWLWALLRLVAGFSIAGIFTLVEGWINESTPNTVRGQVLAAYTVVNYFGISLGQGLIAVVDPAQSFMFLLTAFLVCASVLPLMLVTIQAPTPIETERFALRQLFKVSPLGCLAVMAAGVLNSVLANFVPVLGRTIDPDNAWIAQLMLAFILSGIVFQVPLGRLSDMFDRRIVLIACGAATGVTGLIGLMIGIDGKVMALVLIAMSGALIPALYSIGVAHTTDFVDNWNMVAASAGLLMIYGIGTVIGPAIAGQLLLITGIGPGIFLFVLVIGGGMAAFGTYRSTVRDTVDDEEKGQFQAIRPTSTVAFEFDPRAEEDQLTLDMGEAGEAYLTASAAGLESIEYCGEASVLGNTMVQQPEAT